MLFDFQDGNGPVSAHKHPYGGGWVADTARVSETAFVGPGVWVYGNARISDDARVRGYAQVYGEARVFGNALIFGEARVFGNASVFGMAWVFGDARVFGDACVYGGARVCGTAWVFGNASVGCCDLDQGKHDRTPLTQQIGDWTAVLSDRENITIGCMSYSLSYWREHLQEIAEANDADYFIDEASAFLDACEERLK